MSVLDVPMNSVLSQSEGILPLPSEATPMDTAFFPYETPDFHQCWWEYLSSRMDIPVKAGDLLIQRKSVLKGLLKLREARVSGWNNAWSQVWTEGRTQGLEDLAQTSQWDYFRMIWKPESEGQQAFSQLSAQGYPMFVKAAPVEYVINLENGLEAYVKGLSQNTRKALNKKLRRAQPMRPHLQACTTEAEVDAFFEEFFPYHIQYWNAKAGGSYFNYPQERHFIVAWAKCLLRSGHLVLDRLMMDDQVVNLSMGIQTGHAFYWLLTINTGLLQDFSPGMVGLYLRLEQAFQRGATQFKMGAGDYFYKVQHANEKEYPQIVTVCNPRTLAGRLYALGLRRPSCLSSWLKAVPGSSFLQNPWCAWEI